jgi:hypothetical protein
MGICLCFDASKPEVKKAIRDGDDSLKKLSAARRNLSGRRERFINWFLEQQVGSGLV